VAKIHENGVAPFRFLTPFPHRLPRRLLNSALKHVTSDRKSGLYHFSSGRSSRAQTYSAADFIGFPRLTVREGSIFKVASSIPLYFARTILKKIIF